MRAVVLLVWLTSCQVVFPLRGEVLDAQSSDGLDLSRPLIAIAAPDPVIAGEPIDFTVSLTGTPSSLVTFDVELSQGDPRRIKDEITLGGSGVSLSTFRWTPPAELGRVPLTLRADYDADLSDASPLEETVPVSVRFGQRQVGSTAEVVITAKTAVAMQFDSTSYGEGILGTLTAQLRAESGECIIGVYSGNAKPEMLISKTAKVPIPVLTSVLEAAPPPQVLPPGKYWIVFVANKTTLLTPAIGGGSRTATLPSFDLPPTFPALDAGTFMTPVFSALVSPP